MVGVAAAIWIWLDLRKLAELLAEMPQTTEGSARPKIAAEPLSIPPLIVPEWYLLPPYAVLRAGPDKVSGIIAMVGFVLAWAALPWLDRSQAGPIWRRGRLGWILGLAIFLVFALGLLATTPPDGVLYLVSQALALALFLGCCFWCCLGCRGHNLRRPSYDPMRLKL